MAMNRLEQAAMHNLRILSALQMPEPETRLNAVEALAAAKHFGMDSCPAWTFNAHTLTVSFGVFNVATHLTDNHNSFAGIRRNWSQGCGGPWFTSRASALRAMKYAVAMDCAKKMASVQAMIDGSEDDA